MYDALAPYPWSCRFISCLAEGYRNGDQRRPISFGSGRNFYLYPQSIKKNNADLRELLGLEPVSMVIKKGSLRWFGHMECKNDYDWNVD